MIQELYQPGTTTILPTPYENVEEQVVSGARSFEKGTFVYASAPDGQRGSFPAEEARSRFIQGYKWESPHDTKNIEQEELLQKDFGSPMQEIGTGLLNFGDTMSWGATDVLAAGLFGRDYVAKLDKANPGAADLGAGLGYVAPLAAMVLNPALGLGYLGGSAVKNSPKLFTKAGREAYRGIFGSSVDKALKIATKQRGPISKGLTAQYDLLDKGFTTLLGATAPASVSRQVVNNMIRYGGEGAAIAGIQGLTDGLIYPERFSAEIWAKKTLLTGAFMAPIGIPGPVLGAGYRAFKGRLGKELTKPRGLYNEATNEIKISNLHLKSLGADERSLSQSLEAIVAKNKQAFEGYPFAKGMNPVRTADNVSNGVVDRTKISSPKGTYIDAVADVNQALGVRIEKAIQHMDEIVGDIRYSRLEGARSSRIISLAKKLKSLHFTKQLETVAGGKKSFVSGELGDEIRFVDAFIADLNDAYIKSGKDSIDLNFENLWRIRQKVWTKAESVAPGPLQNYYKDVYRAIEGTLPKFGKKFDPKIARQVHELSDRVSIYGQMKRFYRKLPVEAKKESDPFGLEILRDPGFTKNDLVKAGRAYLENKLGYVVTQNARWGVDRKFDSKGYSGWISDAVFSLAGAIPGLYTGGIVGGAAAGFAARSVSRGARKYGHRMIRNIAKLHQEAGIEYTAAIDNAVTAFFLKPGRNITPVLGAAISKELNTRDEFEEELFQLGKTQENFVDNIYELQQPMGDLYPQMFDDYLSIFFEAHNFLAARFPLNNSNHEITKYQKYRTAIINPQSIYDHLENGYISLEEKEAMQAVYPNLYEDLKERMIDGYLLLEAKVPYEKKIIMNRVFDVPIDRTMEKGSVMLLQRSSASEIAARMAEEQKPPSRPGTQRTGGVKGMNRRGRGMSQTDKLSSQKVGD